MAHRIALGLCLVALVGCAKTASSSFLNGCHSDGDCAGGLVCPTSGMLQGHCTLTCRGADSDHTCQSVVGANAYCDVSGYCNQSCASASCPSGFSCAHDGIGFAYCQP